MARREETLQVTRRVSMALMVVLLLSGSLPEASGCQGVEAEREALEKATVWLEQHAAECFREDEPLYGLLPSLVGCALYSAGRIESSQAIDAHLMKEAERITETPAQAAFLFLLSFQTPFDQENWEWRSSVMLSLMRHLLDQGIRPLVAYQRPRARYFGASSGKATPIRSMRRSSARRRASPDLGVLAAMAVAFRSVERFGFNSGGPATDLPWSWAAMAAWAMDTQAKDGAVARSTHDRPDGLGTTCAALILALARPVLVTTDGFDDGLIEDHGRLRKSLARALRWLDRKAPARSRSLDWNGLLEVVVRSRLDWCLGREARHLSRPASHSWLAWQEPDGSFKCAGPLPCAPGSHDIAGYYEDDPVGRLLATALATLALSQCGRRAEIWARDSSFTRLSDLVAARPDSLPLSLVEEILLGDASASLLHMTGALDDEREPVRSLATRLLSEHVGWDLAAGDLPAGEAAERFRLWLDAEARGWEDALAWRGLVGRSLHVLARTGGGGTGVAALARLAATDPDGKRADIALALHSSLAAERALGLALAEALGAPASDYDPERTPAENGQALERLDEWLGVKDGM